MSAKGKEFCTEEKEGLESLKIMADTIYGCSARVESKGDANNNSTVEKGRSGEAVRKRIKGGRTCPKPGKQKSQ